MGHDRSGTVGDDRASAATAVIVFTGLTIFTALLAGGFYVVASNGGDPGDPTKLELDASRCSIVTQGDETGVGEVTLSVRYRGNGTVDVSEATVVYSDENHESRLDVGGEATASTAKLRNETGAYDDRISSGEVFTLVVAADAVRGSPLPSLERARFDLMVPEGTVSSTSIRVPGATNEGQSFVDC